MRELNCDPCYFNMYRAVAFLFLAAYYNNFFANY